MGTERLQYHHNYHYTSALFGSPPFAILTSSLPLHKGELQHRVVKSYGTKKKGYVQLATRIQRRSELLHRITGRVQRLGIKAGHKCILLTAWSTRPSPILRPQNGDVARCAAPWTRACMLNQLSMHTHLKLRACEK